MDAVLGGCYVTLLGVLAGCPPCPKSLGTRHFRVRTTLPPCLSSRSVDNISFALTSVSSTLSHLHIRSLRLVCVGPLLGAHFAIGSFTVASITRESVIIRQPASWKSVCRRNYILVRARIYIASPSPEYLRSIIIIHRNTLPLCMSSKTILHFA
jgi:hypothetical protein